MSEEPYRRKPQVTTQYGPVPEGYEWVVYDRISDDREGTGLGVQRQERINFAVAERLGGAILTTLADNDVTANDRSRRHKKRPGYDELCRLLREKPGMRGVIVWHSDRLHRSPRELEDFLDLCEEVQPRVHTVQAGPIDLTTPGGRAMARTMCNMARYESEIKAERIRAKAAEIADAGGIASGGPRPFGYERIYAGEGPSRKILRDELHPAEAPIVGELARRFLAGDTLRSLVRWLNATGIKTTTGRAWSQQGLRIMLLSARIAGLREHHGQVVAKAQWPAIVTAEQHQLMRQMLTGNQRPPGSRVRIHFLSGFVYCSDCGTKGVKMRVCPQHKKLKYKCLTEEGGCNGRVIGLEDLQAFIKKLMVAKLSDPETLRELAARDADQSATTAALLDQIEADERRLKLLQASLDDGDEEDLPEVLTSVRHVRRRLKSSREQLGALTGSGLDEDSLPDLALRWDDLDLDQKQRLLRLFVDRIEILPARRGLPRFDPQRVQVVPVGG
jgi:site-specific DNA recombinase